IQPQSANKRGVIGMWVAIPPQMSPLSALVQANRAARTVEIIVPLLAADADDLDRAKSDLERAVGWGASDVALSSALGESFEAHGRLDEAVQFRQRLTHLLPDDVDTRARLAATYARLGVF